MAMTPRRSPDDEKALALLTEAEGVSKEEATVRAIHGPRREGCQQANAQLAQWRGDRP